MKYGCTQAPLFNVAQPVIFWSVSYTHLFKRRPLESLCRGEQPDETVSQIIMAARLAPSAMNLQPCRYQIEGHKIHIFRGSPPLAIKKFVKLQQIDCGIAMAHIMEQAKFMGIHGKFCKMDDIKTGGTYEMSVILDRCV